MCEKMLDKFVLRVYKLEPLIFLNLWLVTRLESFGQDPKALIVHVIGY